MLQFETKKSSSFRTAKKAWKALAERVNENKKKVFLQNISENRSKICNAQNK